MKKFSFHNAEMQIEQAGYGQYKLSGLGTSVNCTNSKIWDWCDDDSNRAKCQDARRKAYMLLKNNL